MHLLKQKKHSDTSDDMEPLEQKESVAKYQRTDSGSDSVFVAELKKEHFRPDDLPDGACYRPKSVTTSESNDQTAVRPAKYIGSFSVIGRDQAARAEYVQKELEGMRTVRQSKDVLLIISLSGIKVCSGDGQSVHMAHALKRISYATCDPDWCQFSVLAREPKGQMNVQFCHAFITNTQEETEELNAIVGNAFQMAYAKQRQRQPTFNEIIEQQVMEQQAKFKEFEKQEQRNLQAKLNEIATPTPFSEKAFQHLELRRQMSEEMAAEKERDLVVGKNKVWLLGYSPKKAKQVVDKVKHRSPVEASTLQLRRTTSPPSGAIQCRESSYDPRSSINQSAAAAAAKRNSTPASVPSLTNQHQSISVAAMKNSVEINHNNAKIKGSPVTALKDEIDRRFLSNGNAISSSNVRESYPSANAYKREEVKMRHHQTRMVNRPLPAVPANGSPRGSPQHRLSGQQWRSFDDDNLQSARSTNGINDTPKRKPPRPMSEIASGSGTLYDNRFPLNGFGHSQVAEEGGFYIYGPNPNSAGREMMENQNHKRNSACNNQPNQNKGNQRSREEENKDFLRYQNDSPFQADKADDPDRSGFKAKQGLESLMCLDRSHIEDETLRHAPWYQAGIPREIALEILQQEEIGSFIVRDSTTHPGCFALSVRVPKFENQNGISHYLILKTQKGVKLKGLDKVWTNLTALVTHHTVMPEMLPCTLRLPRNSTNPTFKDSDKDDREDDPDYQRLADFSTMMSQLKM
ncbi:uncharacterized protein LOC126827120 isoform X2 [Patella vulgata]|uniref:uncharacterized protein LOC126827120 isoform X2 n=1 Tax=Patella vulgata TaxID=6465 RepID=UPI0024A7CF51|nr:uncharacterized protein LOC126827120 isoform X2 [Patella vulgata]